MKRIVRYAPRLAAIAIWYACSATDQVGRWPVSLERVYTLRSNEGVFAYSRISPDGRFLAYASQSRAGKRSQEVVVIDLLDAKEVFREPGIDAYWSPDGRRMIYLSFRDPVNRVAIRDHATGVVTRDVAPNSLGDYYSWGVHDGVQRILTIRGRYFDLTGDTAVMPAASVPSCPVIGVGERPLLSKDGRRITTFVRGTVVVRNLTGCTDVLDTGLPGAKADFSYDDRYIAFHAPNTSGRGYEIHVVDLQDRTLRVITHLPGSSLFPSWTRDGRLSFRYDGAEYRGFVVAHDILSAQARPLPVSVQRLPARRVWHEIFPETPAPTGLALVLVWGTWSAHAPAALLDLQEADNYFSRLRTPLTVLTATEPGSQEDDVARMLGATRTTLQRIPLAPRRLVLSEAHNQNPTYLLFRDGELAERRFGAQRLEELCDWVDAYRE